MDQNGNSVIGSQQCHFKLCRAPIGVSKAAEFHLRAALEVFVLIERRLSGNALFLKQLRFAMNFNEQQQSL